ncbi:MAG: exo-alpha-sialidase [Deltaproteobacteria bacterium]|nr:exo-alpha-sialidase [Deltaproteobacteria bacterium]
MSSILISTRKGLFVTADHQVSADSPVHHGITRAHFIGDNVTLAMVDPRDRSWYAALDHGHFGVKLHRSDDHGETWTEISTPAYPAQPTGSVEKGPAGREVTWATSLIWALAPALDADGALWCGTLPGGLFRSEDRGATWRLVESLWFHPSRTKWFGGGADDPGIHSICVDPRDPKTVVVGVSCGGVWRTRDAGVTWANTATGMRAVFMPPERELDPDIQDVHLVVQCATSPTHFWAQHHCGIYRSTDDMASWSEIPTAGPSTFGFAVVVDPADPDTAWFLPGVSDQKRIPVGGKLVVTRTRDGGQSFEVLDAGLPTEHAYDVVYRHAFARGPDGTLAFGSTTGNVYASRDRGDTWVAVSNHLPPVHAITFVA